MSKTRIYKTYSGIRERCLNPNSKKYCDYGGRGIQLCEEWNSFETFRTWAIKTGYEDNLTIDRIDVNGNYEPNNCRWVSMDIQGNNKRNNRYIEYKDETKTLAQWAKEYNIKQGTLIARLDRHGMTMEEALNRPVKAWRG